MAGPYPNEQSNLLGSIPVQGLSFFPCGNTITFTAAATPPTPVQATASVASGLISHRILNAGTVLAYLGIGSSATLATTNAGSITTSGPAYPLLPGTNEVIAAPTNSWFTASTATGTAVLFVTPGMGT